MKPPPFAYFAPRTIDEVLALLEQHGADARVLAGGQSLVPLLNLRIMRPAVLIDLNRCEGLDHVERRGDQIAFGPMTRQMAASKSPLVMEHCPLVSRALAWTGPVAVRNRATVGGTLAHADRVAELPAVAVALDAVMVVEGRRGRREIAAADFFLGDLTTAVEADEFLREVRLPVAAPGSHASFAEVSVRQEGVAVVGLAAQIEMDGRRVRRAALAAMGVDAAPVRLRAAEETLMNSEISEATIEAAAQTASREIEPATDLYASAGYRRHVVGSLLKDALRQAAGQGATQ